MLPTKAGVPCMVAGYGAVKVIACIEDPAVINTILTYLRQQAEKALHAVPVTLELLPQDRAPPQSSLFG